ncbi:MAG: hypothetical protein STSR0009_28300 [Methanoregula sp.]
MALKGALEELETEFPNISFKFLKIFENRVEYDEEHKKIIYVYHNRMEPIDEEHDFFIVDIKPELTVEKIKSKIQEIIREKYGNDFEILDNELGISSKYNFTVYFNEPSKFLEDTFNVRLQKGDNIQKLAIRFKYSSNDAKLRIMALSMPDLNSENTFQRIRRFLLTSCTRNVPKKYCQVPLLLRILFPNNRSALCADCVDKNLSKTLLDDIYASISESELLKVS